MKLSPAIFSTTAISLLMITIPSLASAGLKEVIIFDNPLLRNTDLSKLIESVVAQLFPLAITICALIIIWKGFQYVLASSTGNEGKMKEVKNSFFWVIIYTTIIMGAKAIIEAVRIFGEGIR